MSTAIAFAAAAGAGAVLRWIAGLVASGGRLPWGTLVVNLTGSFLLGLLATWSPPAATVAGTAGLGALTTYSTFASELVDGWRVRRVATAVYAVVSVVGGVALAWTGLVLGGA